VARRAVRGWRGLRGARGLTAGRGFFVNLRIMNFIARIEEEQRSGIQEIAGALEKLGARVKQVQPILGLIAGSSEGLSLEQLKIAGIASVEPDRKWGAGMPGTGKPEDNVARVGRTVKDEREKEVRRAGAKRSGGKAKRKD
jgi:hypothetical protein